MKLVSALMPTRGRQEMAMHAVHSFLAQTYPVKELLILDDVDDPSFLSFTNRDVYNEAYSTGDSLRVVHYVAKEQKSIGFKRNWLAEKAEGHILFHWDSDDWSHPDRIATQVDLLRSTEKSVCGFNSILFIDENLKKAWRYQTRDRAVGTSLCYTKEFFLNHLFPDTQQAEESSFMDAAIRANEFVRIAGLNLMVARLHAGNTVPKKPANSWENYQPILWEDIPALFFN